MARRIAPGVIVGAIAIRVWGEDLRRTANSKTGNARAAAGAALQSVESSAEGFLDTASVQVSSALRAGQDAVGPRTVRMP